MKQKEILKAQELTEELEKLYRGKEYVFRGQPNEKFLLLPSAFRPDVIMKRVQEFPATPFSQAWCSGEGLKGMIHPPFPDDYWQTLHVRRLCDLTFYLMHYNYYLANHVAMYPSKFDLATRNMYEKRPSTYWQEKSTFDYLFEFIFRTSIGRETLDGAVINYSVINEEMASYDESLSQHYDTQTAALDFTFNPYVAIYFALQNIPKDSRHISVYAYRHLQEHEKNPMIVESGRPECENLRIERQEG